MWFCRGQVPHSMLQLHIPWRVMKIDFFLHSSGPWKVLESIDFLFVEDMLPVMQVVPSQWILAEWRQTLTLLCPLLWNTIQLLSSSLLGQIILQRSHLDTHSDWSYFSLWMRGRETQKNLFIDVEFIKMVTNE